VVAASGMDVLCHALESYTARPFTMRARAATRPMSQGRNPWSDLGCREAIRLCAQHLAVAVEGDAAAREQMMWAATLAGIAFGNAGVHAPHAMAYAIAGRVREWAPSGYPQAPIVPHGMAVALGAPAVFARFAEHALDRHREAARLLGGDDLAAAVAALSQRIGVPRDLRAVGYTAADVPDLVAGTLPQQRLLANSPCEVDADCLTELFHAALA
jgi:hydroxyacid-oxoacid transhydrogenase